MIAISIFLVVVTVGMGALLNANSLHKKSQDMRSIIDNLSFIMEDMSRSLRMGAYYYCIINESIPVQGNVGVGYTQDCTNRGGISFQASGQTQWVYYLGANPNVPDYNSIFRRIGNTLPVQMTPDEVNITSSSIFSVSGANPPLGDFSQPFVTIKLVGSITSKGITSPFSLQTSVSQRALDI